MGRVGVGQGTEGRGASGWGARRCCRRGRERGAKHQIIGLTLNAPLRRTGAIGGELLPDVRRPEGLGSHICEHGKVSINVNLEFGPEGRGKAGVLWVRPGTMRAWREKRKGGNGSAPHYKL